ncbi:unnamed protein product [Hymenolepis diminuta]|uniref:Uncharacterized protein n=1 Tax=Hymenolepis diminuta TaxID=6216 RepID=A0A564YBA4_HYMDI|nr:unnamed protein product [Hymenolepis diminuta]
MSPSSLRLDLRTFIGITYFHSPSKIRWSRRATCEKTTSSGTKRGDRGRGSYGRRLMLASKCGCTITSISASSKSKADPTKIFPDSCYLPPPWNTETWEVTSKFVEKQLSIGGIE